MTQIELARSILEGSVAAGIMICAFLIFFPMLMRSNKSQFNALLKQLREQQEAASAERTEGRREQSLLLRNLVLLADANREQAIEMRELRREIRGTISVDLKPKISSIEIPVVSTPESEGDPHA